MTVSLIITTYNWKEALSLVLSSILIQSKLPNEVIIADDGSASDTKVAIEHFQKKFPIPLIHSWQEDNGFQAAKSRNKAISKATSEYIILIDGDMILHKDFILEHVNFIQEETFVQGSRVLLTANKTEEILKSKQLSFSLFEKGLKNRQNRIHSTLLSKFFQNKNSELKGIKTCNLAFFRRDCILVNGFNESFVGWGREDSEFIVRLLNKNILRRNLKFNAIAYHIFHNENSRKMLTENDKLLDFTISNNLTWCENGIDKYLKEK